MCLPRANRKETCSPSTAKIRSIREKLKGSVTKRGSNCLSSCPRQGFVYLCRGVPKVTSVCVCPAFTAVVSFATTSHITAPMWPSPRRQALLLGPGRAGLGTGHTVWCPSCSSAEVATVTGPDAETGLRRLGHPSATVTASENSQSYFSCKGVGEREEKTSNKQKCPFFFF